MQVILIFYVIICFVWTIARYRINKNRNMPLKKRLLYILFDFLLYPISYFVFTYVDILEMYERHGQKRKEKEQNQE